MSNDYVLPYGRTNFLLDNASILLFRQPENSEQLAVSSEQVFRFALSGKTIYFFDNAAIIFQAA